MPTPCAFACIASQCVFSFRERKYLIQANRIHLGKFKDQKGQFSAIVLLYQRISTNLNIPSQPDKKIYIYKLNNEKLPFKLQAGSRFGENFRDLRDQFLP